ncbi:hypothetical protein CEXT_419001 [Caerostris extrusa]|uniref:Uncharacterized protein n=1 Tax=Caerostris extrusa TaxID=172846 RepID=A0AAV4TAZ7_CAEEX|nr:hypothetical protein CEXT_419001 [Caerostris extrusa]
MNLVNVDLNTSKSIITWKMFPETNFHHLSYNPKTQYLALHVCFQVFQIFPSPFLTDNLTLADKKLGDSISEIFKMLRVFKTFSKNLCVCMGVEEGAVCRFPIRWDSNTCPGEPHLFGARLLDVCNSQMVTERASAACRLFSSSDWGSPPVSLSHFDIAC